METVFGGPLVGVTIGSGIGRGEENLTGIVRQFRREISPVGVKPLAGVSTGLDRQIGQQVDRLGVVGEGVF